MVHEKHLLFWEEHPVGWIVVQSVDMWYWDCQFESLNNQHSFEFIRKASKLVVKSVFGNFELGMPALVDFYGEGKQKTQAIIMGMEKEIIYLRTVYL